MNELRKFNRLSRLLSRERKTRRDVFAAGVFSVLCLIGGTGFAQNSSIPVAGSAWTSPSGRAIVDLNAKKAQAKKARPIRQTQALTAPQDDAGDLLAPPVYDDPLSPPPADSESDELLDPTTLERAPANPALDPLDDVPTELTPSETAPVDFGATDAIPTTTRETPNVATPTAPRANANVAPSLTTDAPQPLERLDGAANATNGGPAKRGAYYGSISNTPRVSTNPYTNLGQAEYNPRQFNACGGNYSANGYRSTPPAAAYGQNLLGGPCVEAGGVCGAGGCYYFGGLLQNTSLSAGALAMRSPLDLDDAGNFGADFSLNWGSAQPLLFGLSGQSGARLTQTDFNGTDANGYDTDDARTQLFWTTGLYFRAPAYSNGWSAGIVYDYLKEDYYRNYELGQLRAELSRSFAGFCEIGFRGAFALNEQEIDLFTAQGTTVTAKAQAVSYYTMFLRKRFENGAEATAFGGATEWSEGIVGASFEAPLSQSFAVRGGATYVIPTERGLNDSRLEENWNVSCGLVWRLGGNAQDATDTQRPLFDVADNGSFLQNFLR